MRLERELLSRKTQHICFDHVTFQKTCCRGKFARCDRSGLLFTNYMLVRSNVTYAGSYHKCRIFRDTIYDVSTGRHACAQFRECMLPCHRNSTLLETFFVCFQMHALIQAGFACSKTVCWGPALCCVYVLPLMCCANSVHTLHCCHL